jgi:peptide/nickel transport system substrate-binding protein
MTVWPDGHVESESKSLSGPDTDSIDVVTGCAEAPRGPAKIWADFDIRGTIRASRQQRDEHISKKASMEMKEQHMKRSRIALGGLLVAALALTGCSGNTGAGDESPAILTLGVGAVGQFDPTGGVMSAAGEGFMVWQGVYDTLIVLEADGSFSPGLAESWEYDESLTELTLNLREGITFSDGEEFDAEAAKVNIDRYRSTPHANQVAAASISEVDAVDDTTLRISLSAPDPGLEFSLSSLLGVMVSPLALEDDEELANRPVGTGPYEMDVDRTAAQVEAVFTRRDIEHWNAERWEWDEIVLREMSDQSARVNALRAGEIDGTMVNAQAADEVEASGFNLETTPGDTVGLGLFDRDGVVQPALADVRVRQAINYAFDREEMLEAIQLGYGQPAGQLFPGIEPIGGTEYDYDVERARELMAEAGYADGFTLTGVDLGTGNPLYAIITDRLGAIGIDMQWQAVAPTEVITEMFSGKHPVLMSSWSTDALGGQATWMYLTGFLHPEGLWNIFSVEDPELMAMIEDVRVSTPEERDDIYAEIDGWVTTNAWFAPFYQTEFIYAHSDRVNVEMAEGNASPFLWSIKPAE